MNVHALMILVFCIILVGIGIFAYFDKERAVRKAFNRGVKFNQDNLRRKP